MKNAVAPYLRPASDDPSIVTAVIRASHSSGTVLADGGVLQDWVRGMPIDVEASIDVVRSALMNSTGLTQDSRVVLLLSATYFALASNLGWPISCMVYSWSKVQPCDLWTVIHQAT